MIITIEIIKVIFVLIIIIINTMMRMIITTIIIIIIGIILNGVQAMLTFRLTLSTASVFAFRSNSIFTTLI